MFWRYTIFFRKTTVCDAIQPSHWVHLPKTRNQNHNFFEVQKLYFMDTKRKSLYIVKD